MGYLIRILAVTLLIGLPVAASAQFRHFAPRPAAIHHNFSLTPASFARPTGFVHRTVGSYSPATGAFNPGLSGNYYLASRMPFAPTNGAFVPNRFGPFTLYTGQAINPATGAFVPSSFGPYWAATRGAFVPTTGAYVHRTAGNFSPLTGAFTPNSAGPYTLAARGAFAPSNGTFVPTAFGPFALSTREAINPATGTLFPSPNGQFVVSTRGSFLTPGVGNPSALPAATLLTSARATPRVAVPTTFAPSMNRTFATPYGNLRYSVPNYSYPYFAGSTPYYNYVNNPLLYTNPFVNTTPSAMSFQNAAVNQATINSLALQSGLYSYWGYRPHWGWPPYYNPYASAYGYGMPYIPPYSSGGYGISPATMNGGGNAGAVNPVPLAQQPQQAPAFEWPLALRMMTPDQKRMLLDPLEAQLQVVAKNGNAQAVQAARQTVAALQDWLHQREGRLADATIREADAFLRRLDQTLVAANAGKQ